MFSLDDMAEQMEYALREEFMLLDTFNHIMDSKDDELRMTMIFLCANMCAEG